jgi:hypothetical protein
MIRKRRARRIGKASAYRADKELRLDQSQLWVRGGSVPACTARPFYPQEQTWSGRPGMSKVPRSDIDSITIRPLGWQGS